MWNKYLNWTIQIQSKLRFKLQTLKRQRFLKNQSVERFTRDDLREALVKLLMA